MPTIKSLWRVFDGLILVEELERNAIPVSAEMPGWETIQLAYKRRGILVRQIIDAIREAVLVAGKRQDAFGYHGIVVKVSSIDGLREQRR
ncbi:hypothetical protein [Qingshengfaniella alkalisoli]|uniref:Uncharacterized protein n=1 Tax=Qingshengfaniella alkalisoli TaxID=2599296 RepID=A0A5B8IBL4_9RHOB|nr:hypothetical protein [Qingshengfaniella alkalisoli]QDY71629.1 hypothetical protein FPZ52_18370 [Qingshengfaniella alkalisoli]